VSDLPECLRYKDVQSITTAALADAITILKMDPSFQSIDVQTLLSQFSGCYYYYYYISLIFDIILLTLFDITFLIGRLTGLSPLSASRLLRTGGIFGISSSRSFFRRGKYIIYIKLKEL
jgi:hypothetical protein